MAEFPYRVRGPEAVPALVARLRADPAFVGGCLVIGGAHGFIMEMEYLQRADGTVQYSAWSDVQGVISTEERTVEVDFAAELARIRAAGIANTKRPDAEDGHSTFIALATSDGGAWVEAPTPVAKQPTAPGVLDPIFNLVFPS